MKKILFLLATLFLISACENNPEKKNENIPKEKLVEVKDGVFTEWYPGKKQIKFQSYVHFTLV